MIFQFRRIEGGAVEDGKLVGGQVKVRNINAETREEAEEKLRLMDENLKSRSCTIGGRRGPLGR